MIVKDEPTIENTLEELAEEITRAEAECIVVDASEGRLSEIASKYPWVLWLDFHSKNLEKKTTIAEQRNVGVQASTGQVIVFCDAGGSPEPGWLNAICTPLLSGEQNLVGGPIRATNSTSANIWTNRQPDGEEIQYPSTANLGITRKAFNLVGGFNEEFEYGSDADFVWRLNDQGIMQACVASAIMGLDGGTKGREHKRAWRYGKALANLLLAHPKRRFKKLMSNPEIWIYPVLTIIPIMEFLTIGFSKILISTVLVMNLFLVLKNIRSKHPVQVLLNHYIYGWGFCYQLLRRLLPTVKLTRVLVYPSDEIRYLEELFKGFKLAERNNTIVGSYPKLTPSNTLNIFLLPCIAPILRLRGVKIIHIHWLYRFNLAWSNNRLSSIFIEKWFKFWIQSLQWVGIKIVWTAHNILPHDSIFRDDSSIRKHLVQHCASVVALSSEGEEEVKSSFSAEEVVVIPEGPLFHPTTFSTAEFRSRLHVPESSLLLVSLGSLAPYKGIEDLLKASQNLDKKISIRVAGWCAPAEQKELERLCYEASVSGSDISIVFGKLTNNQFGGYLKAADFYIAPFRVITNSGSLNAALSAGLPVVIPDLPSLRWIPRDAAVSYQPDETGSSLSSVLNSLVGISEDKIASMQSAAAEFTAQNSWALVAERHISLYK